jgi:hypothetical protein
VRRFMLFFAVLAVMSATFSGVGMGGVAASTFISPSFQINRICPRSSSSTCMNLQNGRVESGTSVQMWTDTSAAGRNNECWGAYPGWNVTSDSPFTGGLGLNVRYEGDLVYQYPYFANCNSDAAGCLGINSQQLAVLLPCSDSATYFVEPTKTGLGPQPMISVAASDKFKSPEYMDSTCTLNGCQIEAYVGVEYWQQEDA